MEQWFVACRRRDIPADRGWPVTIQGHPIAVFAVGDALFALDNVCMHIGSPIDDGAIADGCVTCPWHGWRYDLATGDQLTAFGQKRGLHSYPVRDVDGTIEVAVEVR
ncbi:MAG: Rieske (2Fe-2S) protein [Acidimicrobiales bacterium]